MANINCSSNYKYYHLQHYAEPAWKDSIGVVLAILSPLAIILNIILLVTLRKYHILHTITYRIMTSLVLSDFLAGFTVGPITSLELLKTFDESDCFVDMLCIYLEYLFVGSSALSLAFMCYDRYLHLTKLENHQLGTMKSYIVILSCWLFPLLLIVIGVVEFDVLNVAIALLATIVPIILLISWCFLLIGLHRHSLHRANKMLPTGMANERRPGWTIVVILTCYLLTLVPHIISFSLYLTGNYDEVLESKCFILATTFVVLRAIINPVTYFFNTPSINRCVKTMLGIRSNVQHNKGRAISMVTEFTSVSIQNGMNPNYDLHY